MTVTEKWAEILIISSLQLILWEPQTSFYILNFFPLCVVVVVVVT